MADSFIFLIVMIGVPVLCRLALKREEDGQD